MSIENKKEDENNISNVYYTLSGLKDDALQYVIEGPLERVSQIHDYLKEKFSFVGREGLELLKGACNNGKQVRLK